MRKTIKGRLVIAAVALAALLLAASPVTAASSISVTGFSVQGSVVMVNVKNTSSSPIAGTVAVQAKVGGLTVFGTAPVALSGSQSATVGVAFVGTVCKVLSVGVSDDINPL